MNDTGDDLALERKIEEIINKVIRKKGISIYDNTTNSSSTENLSTEELDLIKNIF